MKAYRNLLIIICVVLILAGGLFAVTKYEPKSEDEASPTLPPTVTVYQTEKVNIQSLRVENPEESYTLVKKSDGWAILEDASVVLDTSRVDSLLYECANIAGQKLVAENVQDLSQYGLDKPQRSVAITMQDGKTVKILIGNSTFENSVSYLMVEGEGKVYTKSTSGCKTLTGNISALMTNSIYTMDGALIGGVEIKRTGGETIVLDRVKLQTEGGEDAFEWTMTSPIYKTANTYRIEEELLTNLLTQTAVETIPIPKDGFDYGMDSPRAVYSLTSLDRSETYTITVGKTEGSHTYIRKQGEKTIYKVATDKLDFLELSYTDLVDKLIHLEDIKKVSEVNISGLGKDFTFGISAADAATYTINGKEIHEDVFKKVYQTVIGLVLNEYATSDGGKAVFTITYKQREGGQNVVACHEYDDRNYLVKVNGKGNLVIRKKQIDTMIESIESAMTE